MMTTNNYFYQLMEFVRNPSTWNEDFQENTMNGYYSPLEVTQSLLRWEISEEMRVIIDSPEVKELWQYYILANNLHEDIVSNDFAIDTLTANTKTMNQIFGHWWNLFITKLYESYPRFKPIITYYKNQENLLMQQIKNTSLVKFNDTPQSIEDFENDKYVSHLTKSENNTDGNTPIQRLEEIRQMWKNIYKEWNSLFDELFIEVM